ncbi:outer membrane beta-barrel protein [Pedobacter psychrotolerans]|uniref:outer membrane beta-barrel protein n=1 Tax=Pedobacter psychrotolerans TaxID=1843235 RepID=UPI003F957AAF
MYLRFLLLLLVYSSIFSGTFAQGIDSSKNKSLTLSKLLPVATKNMRIQGTVIDSIKNEPIEYATIILQDSLMKSVRSAFTNSKGEFLFDKLPSNRYSIVISSMGYTTKLRSIPNSNQNDSVNLGSILIYSSAKNLNQVTISATRPILRQSIDRLTYDIQADPESRVKNVLDMMRKIPLLTVDDEDNIQLKGNSNYRILINGKPSSLIAKSPKDVLRGMSASNIQRIEVITTPPAKYEGEGLAGIINIITNKNIDNGYNGNLNSSYKFPVGGFTNTGSINLKHGKVSASVVAGISDNVSPKSMRLNKRETFGDSPTLLDQTRVNNFNARYRYLASTLSVELDSLNLISADFTFNNGFYHSYNDQNSTLTGVNNEILESFSVNNVLKNPFLGIDAGLNYQLGFSKKKDKLITFSYVVRKSKDDTDYLLKLDNKVNYTGPDFMQVNNTEASEQAVQVDYVNSYKNLKVEAGFKGIFRNNKSNYEYSIFNNQTSQYELESDKSNQFDNDQRILGIYNSYQLQLKNLGIQAGIRLEQTKLKSYVTSLSPELNDNYYNIIPSVSTIYKFNEGKQSINLGYTQRIQRPNIWNLNPFVDRSNPSYEIAGNPNLRPIKSNNIIVNYSNFKKLTMNIGVSYAFANNTIQQISVYNESTRVTTTNYDNIGKDRLLGFDFNISYPITSGIKFSTGGNLAYVWLEGMVDDELIKTKGLKGTAFARVEYTINKGMHVNAAANYQSANITLQERFRPTIYSSFSIDKDLISEKLIFAANINNPFEKYRDFRKMSVGSNFSQVATSINYYRSFTFSLNYKFGRTGDLVKKNKRSIKNDDSSGGKQ